MTFSIKKISSPDAVVQYYELTMVSSSVEAAETTFTTVTIRIYLTSNEVAELLRAALAQHTSTAAETSNEVAELLREIEGLE